MGHLYLTTSLQSISNQASKEKELCLRTLRKCRNKEKKEGLEWRSKKLKRRLEN